MDARDKTHVREAASVVRAVHATCTHPAALPAAPVVRAAAWELRLELPDVLKARDVRRLGFLKKDYATALLRAFPSADAADRLRAGVCLLLAGLPPRLVGPAVKLWGRDAAARVDREPYGAVHELGGTLDDADAVVKDLSGRVLGAARWALLQAAKNGDTAVHTTRVVADAVRRYGAAPQEAQQALADAVLGGKLRLLGPPDATECVAEPEAYKLEADIAALAVERARRTTVEVPVPTDDFLTPDQKRAVQVVGSAALSILTGGPGTGKTTVVRALVDALGEARCMLTAPTGRAARNVGGNTVHSASGGRLLRRRPLQETTRADVPDDLKLLVVDEASMLTAELMMSVLSLAPHGCHVVLVGDADQLPPVGPGNVLVDLLHSGKVPVARLTHNHRSVTAVQRLAAAVMDPASQIPTDFAGGFVDDPDPLAFAARVCGDTGAQVLVPRNATRDTYNRAVQMALREVPLVYSANGLHPRGVRVRVRDGQAVVRFESDGSGEPKGSEAVMDIETAVRRTKPFSGGAEVLLPGDLVMALKNQNKKRLPEGRVSACNGDIGVYAGGNALTGLLVQFKGGEAAFPRAEGWLTLAYAATVHKFQGSECESVVLPLAGLADSWDRQLLYTAITRAKSTVYVLGTADDVGRVRARARPRRLTVLSKLL